MKPLIILMLTFAFAVQAQVRFLQPPLGLDVYMPAPESNTPTAAKAAKGKQLFFDKRLSRDETLSCASCHDPERAFTDGRTLPRGLNGTEGTRNVPAIINRGYGKAFFWDGRAKSLEQQVLEPITNPKELGLPDSEIERRTGMKAAEVAAALASYVRTIRSGNSSYDRHLALQKDALSELEKTGLEVFRTKGQCGLCHAGPNFSDDEFHNTGVAWRDGRFTDDGRFAASGVEKDRGAFKTPTLREIARTAPYMHDGSIDTLEDVVEFYSNGGRDNPNLDPLIRARNFNAEEKRALVAFLRALNGQVLEGWR